MNLVFLMVMPYPFIWTQNLVKFTKTMGHNYFLQFSQKDQNGCKRFCNSTLHIRSIISISREKTWEKLLLLLDFRLIVDIMKFN